MKRIWVLTAVAGLMLSTSGCEREKDRLDAEVRRLCAVDGGVRVHETVMLAGDEYQALLNRYGELQIPSKKFAKPSDAFYLESARKQLKSGNPEMWRSEFSIVRRSDGKILASSVYYTRRGGDMPGPWHESSFSCPDTRGNARFSEQAIKRTDKASKGIR